MVGLPLDAKLIADNLRSTNTRSQMDIDSDLLRTKRYLERRNSA